MFVIGRERTKENKPDGEEYNASWSLLWKDDEGNRRWAGDMGAFLVRYKGKDVIDDAVAKECAQKTADAFNDAGLRWYGWR